MNNETRVLSHRVEKVLNINSNNCNNKGSMGTMEIQFQTEVKKGRFKKHVPNAYFYTSIILSSILNLVDLIPVL